MLPMPPMTARRRRSKNALPASALGRRDKLARAVGGVFQRFQAGTLSMRCVPFGG